MTIPMVMKFGANNRGFTSPIFPPISLVKKREKINLAVKQTIRSHQENSISCVMLKPADLDFFFLQPSTVSSILKSSFLLLYRCLHSLLYIPIYHSFVVCALRGQAKSFPRHKINGRGSRFNHPFPMHDPTAPRRPFLIRTFTSHDIRLAPGLDGQD